MKYLAIDHGCKRIGLAICDAGETICSPLVVLDGQPNPAQKIAEIIADEQIDAVVVGLPLNMDGTEGGQVKIVRSFAAELKSLIGDMPIHFQDERLSSFDAKERISAAEFTNKKKKKRLDAIAAAAILESFLESKK